jgi:hypothetical protein
MKSLCFPYCPGIPWNINDNNVIVRKLNGMADYLLTKDLNIVCHGGLLESFISTFAIEYLNFKYPSKKIIWHGSKEYENIIMRQGIASFSGDISKEISESYPIHFFKDKENNTYFNLLDNYFNYNTYLGKKIKPNKLNFLDTLNKNFMVAKLLDHKTKFRVRNVDSQFDLWLKLNKNVLTKPYVLFLPDRLTSSLHHLDFINLSPVEIRALASVLASKGIQVIIMADDQSKYYGNYKFIKYSFDRFMYLAENAKVVLSRQPDFSLISLIMYRNATYSYMIRHMPKIKLKPTMRRVNGQVDPGWKYLKWQNTLPHLIDNIVRNVYER